jgi:hypothetical protein
MNSGVRKNKIYSSEGKGDRADDKEQSNAIIQTSYYKLDWVKSNIPSSLLKIVQPPKVTIITDVVLKGWGAIR